MNDRIAAKEYYSIGEVCEITDLKPHVLRYWESQFSVLKPTKNARFVGSELRDPGPLVPRRAVKPRPWDGGWF